MAQLPLDMTFLLAAWLEVRTRIRLVLRHGCLPADLMFDYRQDSSCVSSAGLCCSIPAVATEMISTVDSYASQVMVGISCVMFFISTWHLAMNAFRLLQGFAVHAGARGGALAYLGNMRMWDHILKDTLYATQEILGNAAGIYRCFILWNSDWRIIALPLLLLVGSIVSGYTVCAHYTQVEPTETIFDPRLKPWLEAFYSIAVVQNVITTTLMAFRIWRTSAQSAQYRTENALLPVVRILIESAALQLIVEGVLLALYSRNANAQYVLMELVTPTVGITFNAITIRIKLRAIQKSASSTAFSRSDQVQTIGSVPMKRIQVDITTEMEDDAGMKQSFPASSVHTRSEA